DGQVVHGNPKRYLSYGELVEAAAKLPIPNLNTVPLKNSDDFTLVGHDTRRFEVRDKATGSAKFGIDSRVPGMLFAVVARCPVFGGKVTSFDATKAKAVAGVRVVIRTSRLHGTDELHRAHPARRRGSVDSNSGAPMGASRHCRSIQTASGKSDRTHHADGRRFWPPLPGRFRDGSSTSSRKERGQ